MPVAPKTPLQWSCSRCGWRQDAVMRSDVLVPRPERCPKCGGDELVVKPTSFLDKLQNLWR